MSSRNPSISFLLFLLFSLTSCFSHSKHSLLGYPEEEALKNSSEISQETIIASVLQRIASKQKVYLYKSTSPEAWSTINKTFLSTSLLQLLQSSSALCFVLAHELGHLELHQQNVNSHENVQRELEADTFAVERCSAAGYASYPAISLLEDLAKEQNNTNILETRIGTLLSKISYLPNQFSERKPERKSERNQRSFVIGIANILASY